MAIRPVDLQLAYMAAPQNAAVLNAAQEAQTAGQQAQASAFAAEVAKREEHVDAATEAKGAKVRPRGDREPQERPKKRAAAPHGRPGEDSESPAGYASGEGEHFIDVTV